MDLGATQHCCRAVAKLTCIKTFSSYRAVNTACRLQSVSAAVPRIVGNMLAVRG